jgi:hypothetical protein
VGHALLRHGRVFCLFAVTPSYGAITSKFGEVVFSSEFIASA